MNTQKYHICKAVFIFCFWLFIFLYASPTQAPAQSMVKEDFKMFATSAKIDSQGNTYIVLYWKKAKDVAGYNLYRKDKGASTYPRFPVNGKKLIKTAADCNELKTFISVGSKEWEIMENAFVAANLKGKTGIKKRTAPDLGKKSPTPTLLKKDFLKLNRGLVRKEKLKLALLNKSLALCSAFNRGLNEKEETIFDMMALANLKFRLARGLAFIDHKVVAHREYLYELRGVDKRGRERVLATNVAVEAGVFVLPGPPQGFSVSPGDSKALCLWNRKSEHYSYAVSRSKHASGLYYLVNSQPIVFDIESNLEGEELLQPKPGFLDFRRWDEEGNPTTHEVNGIIIAGPENNQRYYYKIACVDILGRRGGWSSYRSAIPRDKTPPTAPGNFRIDVSPSSPSLILTWNKSTRDIDGHKEQDSSHRYYIYRSDSLANLEDIAALSSYQVAVLTANPTDTSQSELTWTDSASILVPSYGEKDFYYRLRCKDARGNLSAPSAAISARVPDTTPPGPTNVVDSKGYSDRIDVFWLPNTEPDLAGYQVWRSVCGHGRPYRPGESPGDPQEEHYTHGIKPLPCDFVLVGQVLEEQAKQMLESTGRIQFADDSVPEGSPICYSYWVRAFDESRNLYEGEYDCPKAGEYICQKLYEETPPPVPIIAAVKARDNAVELKWISSPVQDLRCFHVYRSLKENDAPIFAACVFIDGTSSTTKWEGVEDPSCSDIPADPDPTSIEVSFTDKNLEPKQVYWYRISALDWLGNESSGTDLDSIPAISTFTYSKNQPVLPVVLPPGAPQIDCGRVVRWNPPFDPANVEGFLVFRCTTAAGNYRQVSPIVKGNEFTDKSAFVGKDYWYRVQSIDKSGKTSTPSVPVKY